MRTHSDAICRCGHSSIVHMGALFHGACVHVRCSCRKFTFAKYKTPLEVVEWWISLDNYNPPQKRLSKAHYVVEDAMRTLCGRIVPSRVLRRVKGVVLDPKGNECSRCIKIAAVKPGQKRRAA